MVSYSVSLAMQFLCGTMVFVVYHSFNCNRVSFVSVHLEAVYHRQHNLSLSFSLALTHSFATIVVHLVIKNGNELHGKYKVNLANKR